MPSTLAFQTQILALNSPCFNRMTQSISEFCAFKTNRDLSEPSKESPCKTKHCLPKFTSLILSVPSLLSPSMSMFFPDSSQRPCFSPSNLIFLTFGYLGSNDLAYPSCLSISVVSSQPIPYVECYYSPLGIEYLKLTAEQQ